MIQCLIQVKMLFKIRQLGFRLKRGKVNGVAIAKRSRAHINRRRCRRAPDLGRNEMKHRGQVAGRWEGEPSCQRERVKSSTRSEASKARQNRATEAGGRAATEPEGDALESTLQRMERGTSDSSESVAEGHGRRRCRRGVWSRASAAEQWGQAPLRWGSDAETTSPPPGIRCNLEPWAGYPRPRSRKAMSRTNLHILPTGSYYY